MLDSELYNYRDKMEKLFEIEKSFYDIKDRFESDLRIVTAESKDLNKISAYKKRLKSITKSCNELSSIARRISVLLKQIIFERSSRDWD